MYVTDLMIWGAAAVASVPEPNTFDKGLIFVKDTDIILSGDKWTIVVNTALDDYATLVNLMRSMLNDIRQKIQVQKNPKPYSFDIHCEKLQGTSYNLPYSFSMDGWSPSIPEDSNAPTYSTLAGLLATLVEELHGNPSVFTTCCHDDFSTTNLHLQVYNEVNCLYEINVIIKRKRMWEIL